MEDREPLSKSEVNKIRKEAAKAAWEGSEYKADEEGQIPELAAEDEPAKAPEAKDPEKKEDPWEGVPVHIRTEIEQLRETVKGVGEISTRLKKAEQRLGAYDNKRKELDDALALTKAEIEARKNAPTPEQLAEAKEAETLGTT